MFDISNELGKIHFSENVIYKICSDAAASTGNARVQSFKVRYPARKQTSLSDFSQVEEILTDISIEKTDLGPAITIPVIVRFGVSISATADAIIDHVYRETENVLGSRPAQVTVIVTGTASRTIARRHIEFSR